MKKIWITIIVLVFATFHPCNLHMFNSYPHTAFVSHPRRLLRNIQLMVENHSNSDWEIGLREAAIQALFMENVGDRNLKKRLYSAPLLGKHDLKSTFGDISLVAKGQLYVNYAGYAFVQDEECENTFRKCQDWQPQNNEQLIALWLIKKIRQHSPRLRHPTFDLEYTIIPVDLKYPREYLTYEGNYNYDLPGHVFTLKNFPLEKNQARTEILILQPTEGRIYLPKQVHKNYRFSTSSSAELKMYDYPSTATNNMKQVVYPTEITTKSTSAPSLSTTEKTEAYKGISIINKQIVIANFYTLSPVNIYIPAPTASVVNIMDQFSHLTTTAKETMLYTKLTTTQSSKEDTLKTSKHKTSVTKPFTTTSTIRTTSTQKQRTEVTTHKQTTVAASKIPLSTPKYKPAAQHHSTIQSTTSKPISKKPTLHQPVLVPSTELPSTTTRKKVLLSSSTSTKKQLSTTLKSTVTTTKETTLSTSTTKAGGSLPPNDHQTASTQSISNSLEETQPMEPSTSLETTTVSILTTTPVPTTPSTVQTQGTVTVHMMAPFTTTSGPNPQTTNTMKAETTIYETAENSEIAEISSTKSSEVMTNLSTMEVITEEQDMKTTTEFKEEPIKSTVSVITPATTRKPSTTTTESDFLVEDDDNGKEPISNQKPSKEYDDEDIFGPISPEKQQSSSQQERTTKVYVPSDVEQSLFDGNRKSKAIQMSTETTYLPPIMPTTTASSKSTTEIKKRPVFSVSKKPVTPSGDTIPVTSQSYLTSISYEVNDRKNKSDSGLESDGSSEDTGTDAGNRRAKTVKRFRYKRKKTYKRIPKTGNKNI